jgi:hypothetical protein
MDDERCPKCGRGPIVAARRSIKNAVRAYVAALGPPAPSVAPDRPRRESTHERPCAAAAIIAACC